jgi:hypothetical protein
MRKLIIISIVLNFISCSRTYNIKLSKSKVKKLDVIYQQNYRGKMFDSEWIFYQKNICTYKISFIRDLTITGTWHEKNDTIFADFFHKKFASERRLTINKSNGKLTEIIK